MADKDTIFVLSKEDVIGCAREMGIPEEAITDDILAKVKKAWNGDWSAGLKSSRKPSTWLSRARPAHPRPLLKG